MSYKMGPLAYFQIHIKFNSNSCRILKRGAYYRIAFSYDTSTASIQLKCEQLLSFSSIWGMARRKIMFRHRLGYWFHSFFGFLKLKFMMVSEEGAPHLNPATSVYKIKVMISNILLAFLLFLQNLNSEYLLFQGIDYFSFISMPR